MPLISESPEGTSEPLLVSLIAHWTGLRSGRTMPRRVELHLDSIRHAMPETILFELVGLKQRPRFQSAGTAVEDAMGVRLAGKWVDEVLTGDFLALTANALADIAAAPSIKIYRNRIAVGADELIYDRLLLPYAGPDDRVCFVTSTGGWPTALKDLIDGNRAQVFAPPYLVRAW